MRLAPLVLAAAPLFASCSSSSSAATPGTKSLWVVPATLDDLADVHVYDHPWPSDLRRDADGTIHFAGFYDPRQTIILRDYVAEMKGLFTGFSPAAAGYLRFSGDIDPSTLPVDPPHALDPSSSVQLVDVDPASPERGRRKLVETLWQQTDGVYWLKDTLALRPALGQPLRPSTRYAIVVTSRLRAADGSAIAPSDDLAQVLDLAPVQPRVQAAHDLYAPAIQQLASTGIAPRDVVHLAVFTTNDPTADLFAVADDVHASVPAPTADAGAWAAKDHTAAFDVYEGTYGPSPNYQQGRIPYAQPSDGGAFAFDAAHKPIVANTFPLRFCLVVPDATACPQPAGGYPIVLYAHGTGGDYRSLVDEHNSIGDVLARHCLASMGIDQIFHGTRPGAPPATDPNREADIELLFFNLNNPVAGRTNGQQGAVDAIQEARLFTESHVTVPAAVSRTQRAIAFDASKLLFFGHSQGGLSGPLFLAADKQALGGVLSGSGAMITVALLEKTNPQPSVADAVKLLLGLTHPGEEHELNLFHPVLNLAQTFIDSTDPVHYARYLIQQPRPGLAPKSIYQTEGVRPDGTGDTIAPPHGIEVHGVALGLPRLAPGVHPIAEAPWTNLDDVTVPAAGLSGNLAGGLATGVLAQFVPAPGYDGHFVVFEVPAAHEQAAGFCRDLADDPKGKVPPAQP
jgi:predicted esterase